MAKLSRKKAIRVSFVASKMALSHDHDERMALLTELLDELGIDAEQRADSKESAARHLRYMASRKHKNEQAAKADDLRDSIQQLLAKRDRLLAELGKQETPTTETAQYNLPTQKMTNRLAAFDDLPDDDQVDQLRTLW